MNSFSRQTATMIGFSTIFMWSFLGPFGAASGTVPPFLLNAMCFAISGGLAMARLAVTGRGFSSLRQPKRVWLLGVAGLFGYHAFYFLGLRNAPPLEANLINYLWPVLIVVFSALLPGERLRIHHIIGVLLGLLGVGVLLMKDGSLAVSDEYWLGYLCALAAALFWSSYSVLSRRFPSVPTDAVGGFCIATAVLSLGAHLLFEETQFPQTAVQWAAIVGMGLFPLGLSFFTWDIGMKHGDIQILGASAYAAPLLSTLLMILLGFGSLTMPVVASCLLIVLGAVVAAKDLIFRRSLAASQ
ncbi:EamA family transporter [Rhodobacteraceae bacterium RKSG542]|uniref:aromatic amino acid exporter YddG n=1 Tax=Pseudovibrio flavus TaxID=2529854 RepID=UPI0012BD241B|nr:EamA family transporter [Pseudovibrio flavus]MTI18420.1 EamA family transporter [Pseudovibrio flavus]